MPPSQVADSDGDTNSASNQLPRVDTETELDIFARTIREILVISILLREANHTHVSGTYDLELEFKQLLEEESRIRQLWHNFETEMRQVQHNLETEIRQVLHDLELEYEQLLEANDSAMGQLQQQGTQENGLLILAIASLLSFCLGLVLASRFTGERVKHAF
ncbi:MAG: hypothetical protein Q9184_006285 [Pyrenodesmia sp. 2 TL-2023]